MRQASETKKARSRDLAFVFVVRLAGIEPTTPWFVAKYSIQLSYSRPSTHYSGAALKREARGENAHLYLSARALRCWLATPAGSAGLPCSGLQPDCIDSLSALFVE